MIKNILYKLFERDFELPFKTRNKVILSEQHILAGNPDKLDDNEKIISDRKWQLNIIKESIVKLLTLPFMKKYYH